MKDLNKPPYEQSAIAFIESPFQLLCAIEAIQHFGFERWQIVCRLNSFRENNRQIKRTVELLNIPLAKICIITVGNTITEKMIAPVYSMFLFLKTINCDKVIIGNRESRLLSLVCLWTPKRKLIFVDDGTKTLSKLRAGNARDNLESPATIFTVFKLPLKVGEESFVENTFAQLKMAIQNEANIGKLAGQMFLGCPLSENDIISEVEYISHVKKAADACPGKVLIYIPHRNESALKLDLISGIWGVSIKPISYPIELYAFNEGKCPGEVISFYSTALYTLKKIYGCQVKYIRIDPQKHRASILAVYDYYIDNL